MVRSPERLGRSVRRDRGVGHLALLIYKNCGEKEMDAYDPSTLPLNSLLAPKNSLLGLQTFPVPLHREFRWELLNSLANCTPKALPESLNLQNSLLISLLTGNLMRRLVRRADCNFAPIASELSHRSETTFSANRVITRRSKTAPLFDRLIGNGE
jgi:hypothetical protein